MHVKSSSLFSNALMALPVVCIAPCAAQSFGSTFDSFFHEIFRISFLFRCIKLLERRGYYFLLVRVWLLWNEPTPDRFSTVYLANCSQQSWTILQAVRLNALDINQNVSSPTIKIWQIIWNYQFEYVHFSFLVHRHIHVDSSPPYILSSHIVHPHHSFFVYLPKHTILSSAMEFRSAQ